MRFEKFSSPSESLHHLHPLEGNLSEEFSHLTIAQSSPPCCSQTHHMTFDPSSPPCCCRRQTVGDRQQLLQVQQSWRTMLSSTQADSHGAFAGEELPFSSTLLPLKPSPDSSYLPPCLQVDRLSFSPFKKQIMKGLV